MGFYSEMDLELQRGNVPENGSASADMENAPMAAPASSPAPARDTVPVQTEQKESAAKDTGDTQTDEDAKRKAHEEAEAQRKAEFDAKQAAKKAAEQEQLARLASMSDDEVMSASMERVKTDTEKLTRRNMKDCVAEYIQTMCIEDPAFARRVMHPGKSMIHCIWYINRKAREFVEQEMKDNDIKPENGIYGSDVPDDLCYQWAVDYFNDPDAEEDHRDEEKFVPKPYVGKAVKSKGNPKKAESKKKEKKPAEKPKEQGAPDGQMSLLGVA